MESKWWNSVSCLKDPAKMILAWLFIIVPIVVECEPAIPCDTCIRVNVSCYNVSFLFDLEADFRKRIVIKEMGILRFDDILYYSYEPKIEDPEYFKVGFVKLTDQNSTGVISAPNLALNLGTFSIDQTNRIIYLGGSDGIYQFDANVKNFTHFSSHGDEIVSLFYKNNVYFVRDKENQIVVKKGNEFDSVLVDYLSQEPVLLPKVSVKKFVITNDNVVVFLSSYGLFATQLSKNSELVWLSNNAFFRGLTIDLDGIVYAWWLDGIYKVVLEKPLNDSRVVKVAEISNIGSMVFDNVNNILFTNENSLFSLTQTKANVC